MKKNEEAAAKRKPKTSAAQIRVQKGMFLTFYASLTVVYSWDVDLTELDLPSTMKLYHPDPTNLLNFELTITPDEGVCILSLSWTQFLSLYLQACTRAVNSSSHLSSTPTIPTSHRKSNAFPRCDCSQ